MKAILKQRSAHSAFTLVELLIALALMGGICLTIANFVMKGSLQLALTTSRFQEAPEIQSLISSIESDMAQGAYINPDSSDQWLQYTTYDGSGNAVVKIYQIYTNGGKKYLRLSLDGGSTNGWISPYRVSGITQYVLLGTPAFLYGIPWNQCRDFTPIAPGGVSNNSNTGQFSCVQGSVASGNTGGNTGNGTLGSNMSNASQATKLVLSGFNFAPDMGGTKQASAQRTVLPLMMMTVNPGLVRANSSTITMTSPALLDSSIVTQFPTRTANSLLGPSYYVSGLAWDPSRDRLLVANSGGSTVPTLVTSIGHDGVLIGQDTKELIDGPNGNDAFALDVDFKSFSLGTFGAYVPYPSEGNLPIKRNLGNAVNPAASTVTGFAGGAAIDPTFPALWFVGMKDANDGQQKVYGFNKFTSAAAPSSPWALPAAYFDDTHPIAGLAIEPLTGDFLVLRGFVNNPGTANATIDVWRVVRGGGYLPSSGTAPYFSIKVPSTTLGVRGFTYDPLTNHIFFADNYQTAAANANIYEAIPPLIITQHF